MAQASLFETQEAKGGLFYKLFAASVFAGIISIWVYRATHVTENGWFVWMGMFAAELWFGFYWILSQSLRWRRVYRRTFKDRLSLRFFFPSLNFSKFKFMCVCDSLNQCS